MEVEKSDELQEAEVVESNQLNLVDTEIPEETEEEKQAKREKFLRSAVIINNKTILQDIYRYMLDYSLTLEQIRQEIEEKKCKLTATRRQFLSMYKLDFIQQLFDDIAEKRNATSTT